jgi:hypothetical protein
MSQGERVLKPINILRTEEVILKSLEEVKVVPEAMVALWLGINKAKKLIADRVTENIEKST